MNKVSIIGLGYVGLPLAVEFGKKYKTVGFDIKKDRINYLRKGIDKTRELTSKEIKSSKKLFLTSNSNDIKDSNIYIVTVPTPVDINNKPDLSLIKKATSLISNSLSQDDIVIYESTVYPGTTEEICVPLLEKGSKLKYIKNFTCGYSPERINPGDKKHIIKNITKLISASNNSTLNKIDKLYSKVLKNKLYRVNSIKIAEAAKVIENAQRDINIAFVNELSIIFDKLNLDTLEVLNAASTKWNFNKFTPGLVGGHCIGVDPYYLAYKSKKEGYSPKVILSGRYTNNSMSSFCINKLLNEMEKKRIKQKKSKVLIMGCSFKENCSDVRNSRVFEIIDGLKRKNMMVDVFDPVVDYDECNEIYNIKLKKRVNKNFYDAILIAVSHDKFRRFGIDKIREYGKRNSIIFDLKSMFPKKKSDIRL